MALSVACMRWVTIACFWICVDSFHFSDPFGSVHGVEPATAKIQEFCDIVQNSAQDNLGEDFQKFEAVSFREQVVNGMIFFVKVDVGRTDKQVHLRIVKPPNDGPVALLASKFVPHGDPLNSFI
uniref:Cystatin domain-containing protein n=1 Tax=Noctiluca scintillans TaxID=2966 RepID=A0A7S1ACF3_NOCSC